MLSSKKLAICLMAAIVVTSVFGVVIPQRGSVFKSFWFILLIFIFLINLFSCTLLQLKRLIKNKKSPKSIGTVLFHLALIIIIVGSLITLGFSMSGYLVAGVGETREDSHNNYGFIKEGKLFNEEHGLFSLLLKNQTRHLNGEKIDYTSSNIEVTTTNGSSLNFEVSNGNPASVGNIMLYHHDSGFAPLIEIKKDGKIIFQSYVIFKTIENPNLIRFYLPSSEIQGIRLDWEGDFYPDAVLDKTGKYYNRSDMLRNSVITLKIKNQGKTEQLVLKKGVAATTAGYEFNFQQLNFWTGFDVVYDPGRKVVLTGGVLITIALLLMYFPVPKKVIVSDIRE